MHLHIPSAWPSAWRALSTRTLGLAAAVVLVASCTRGDVGAPCNHGQIEPPASQVVTFPALSCDQLLCVYGDAQEAPDGACSDNEDCNPSPPYDRFECLNSSCQLSRQYILERSMCSKKCGSDADCANGGAGNRVVVDETECGTGFSCAIIQALGTFCCQPVCVCNDDLVPDNMLTQQCEAGTAPGCCVPRPGEDEDEFVPGTACPGG